MLRTRLKCNELINRKIANGGATGLCFDPWIKGKSLSSIVGWSYVALFNSSGSSVSNIINQKEWNINNANH